MKFILGKKVQMSQKFRADGQVVPVTIVKAGPCFISQVKKNDKDGYQAISLGFGVKKKLNKPQSGQLKGFEKARYIKEFRIEGDPQDYQKGQQINVSIFNENDIVQVTANSKGRGFQGVVKRHHFAGAPKTHGDKDQLRHGGSIGSQRPQHVLKNKRMAGRMGYNQVSVKNLEVIEVDTANNILYIKGAIPGSRNTLVKITAPGEMKLSQKVEEAPQKEEASAAPEANSADKSPESSK